MAALQYVHVPNYSAILFRRTYKDLSLPGALMDRAHAWLDGTDAKWSEGKKTWIFPSGATMTFAYLQHENDKYNYQGSEFQFVGFDELTQFDKSQYTYLFSRLRRLKGSPVPIRARVASNPGGRGHEWVKQRFLIEGEKKGRIFIPATLDDNPFLDKEDYEKSLEELSEVEKRQLRFGDWDVVPDGIMFKRQWFPIVEDYPREGQVVRYWDLAATKPNDDNDNPDWSVGVKMLMLDGRYWILDVKRLRDTPFEVERLIRQTAEMDGKSVRIYMEQEPGSAGVNNIDHYRRKVLSGFTFEGDRPTGPKEVRAEPVSSSAQAGNISLVRGDWIEDYLDEIVSFPQKGFKRDQVDATSGAFKILNELKEMKHVLNPSIIGKRRG